MPVEREPSSSTTTISGDRARDPGGPPVVGSSHRSAACRCDSTPSTSPRTSNDPAYALLRTGLTWSSSSGSASSQRRSVTSCRYWRVAGAASSTRSAARSKSSAASCMSDRLGRLAVLLIPRARPPVQIRNVVGLLVEQVRLQHIREELVVAVPLATVVERDQE